MAAEERERATKKKLQAFLGQMLKVGCVKGFKYFSMYMRGREEMICTVLNNAVTPRSASPVDSSRFTFTAAGSGNFDELPLEQKELMLSQNTQQKLSGYGYMDIGLPPASPSEREIAPMNEESTLFLVAGYGKYSCPYVWVRSNHDRLIKVSDNPSFSKDSPLRLKSTSVWGEKDVKVWQILAELVKLCTRPAPKNPFEVDMGYFDSLPQGERVIALGAMAYFLQSVVTQGSDRSFSGLVAEDLREVNQCHLKEFQKVIHQQLATQQQQSEVDRSQTTSTNMTQPATRAPQQRGRQRGQPQSPRGPGMATSQRQQQQQQMQGHLQSSAPPQSSTGHYPVQYGGQGYGRPGHAY